jgi:thiol-disulfide isomerase/thioredoxin
MPTLGVIALCMCLVSAASAQSSSAGPTNEKAKKTYKNALEWVQKHRYSMAADEFKKADKQDGGHCLLCKQNALNYALLVRDWKTAENMGLQIIADAKSTDDQAIAHYEFGAVLLREGVVREKRELFSRAHEELTTALAANPNFPSALFADGQALAHLEQDADAKARFESYVKLKPADSLDRRRALRFVARPELARARMAPAFSLTTKDGQKISLDDLQGKVVLLDFWATWCEPCREALPHMRQIAKKFQGQPLVVLSVSLDDDEETWMQFVAKNQMTWLQYRDGGFEGPIAMLFGVEAIPHTFTIDSDGVLQDERIGDADIEGKLKKLLARAQQVEVSEKNAAATQ